MTLPNRKKRIRFFTIAELWTRAQREPDGWLLDGILPPAGVCLVVGAPMAGKSTFLSVVSACVARGVPVAGLGTAKGPVVWISLEHPLRDLHENLESARRGARTKDRLDRVSIFEPGRRWTLDEEDDVDAMCKALDKLQPALVIVDSIRKASTFEENSASETARVMQLLERLTGGNKRLVIATHHFGKKGVTRGSTHFYAAARSVIEVRRTGPFLSLTCQHHGAAERVFHCEVVRDINTLTLTPCDPPKKAAGTQRGTSLADAEKTILEILGQGSPLSVTKLREVVRKKTRAGTNTLQAAIFNLETSNAIVFKPGSRGAKFYQLP